MKTPEQRADAALSGYGDMSEKQLRRQVIGEIRDAETEIKYELRMALEQLMFDKLSSKLNVGSC